MADATVAPHSSDVEHDTYPITVKGPTREEEGLAELANRYEPIGRNATGTM